MGGSAAKIECRWCGQVRTVKRLRAEHYSSWAPQCRGTQTASWMAERDYKSPGRDAAVLDRAGLLRYMPFCSYIWVENPDFVELMRRQRVPKHSWPGSTRAVGSKQFVWRWVKQYLLSFEPVAPRWAVELARRLMDDQQLVSRLGGAKVEERSGRKWARLQSKQDATPNGLKLVLSVEVRAKILQTASSSSMARELFEDDPLAASIIARDA
jgi:hypothetical protein